MQLAGNKKTASVLAIYSTNPFKAYFFLSKTIYHKLRCANTLGALVSNHTYYPKLH